MAWCCVHEVGGFVKMEGNYSGYKVLTRCSDFQVLMIYLGSWVVDDVVKRVACNVVQ